VWKTIWTLKIPNAAKMFLGRECNDILPTNMLLFSRGVVQEA
jgi:hypothetical protein